MGRSSMVMTWHDRETGHLFIMLRHATLRLRAESVVLRSWVVEIRWEWDWEPVYKEKQTYPNECEDGAVGVGRSSMAWHSMAERLATSLSCYAMPRYAGWVVEIRWEWDWEPV